MITSKEVLIRLIRQEQDRILNLVLSNQTMLVNKLLSIDYESIQFECSHDDFDYQDWENLNEEDQNQILEYLSYQDKEDMICEDNFEDFKDDIISEAKSLGILDKEIYQYFLVDSYLLKQLEDKGETIVNFQDCEQWWGRAYCGQSILLDSVIEDIVIDNIAFQMDISLERLEGLFKEYNFSSGWLCNVNCL